MNFGEYPITLLLIAANVLVSLGGFSNREFLGKTIMWPYGVKRNNQLYRFISSGFLHADMMHLFFNMFTLYFSEGILSLFSAYWAWEDGSPICYCILPRLSYPIFLPI